MVPKCIFSIYAISCAFLLLSWNIGDVNGQPPKRGRVSDLIKRFEQGGSEDRQRRDSNENISFERSSQGMEPPLNRGQNTAIYDEQQPGTSYGPVRRNSALPIEKRSFSVDDDSDDDSDEDNDYGGNLENYYQRDYRNDQQHQRGSSHQMRQTYDQEEEDDRNPIKYGNRDGYLDDEPPRREEGGRMSPKGNVYLGKDFENFNKRLGLRMDDYMSDTEDDSLGISNSSSDLRSNESNAYDADMSSIYEDIQFVKPRDNRQTNDLMQLSRTDKRRNAINHMSGSGAEVSPSRESERVRDPSSYVYDYAYGRNGSNRSAPPNLYSYPEEDFSRQMHPPTENKKSMSSSSSPLQEDYSKPLDSYTDSSDSMNHLYNVIPGEEQYEDEINRRRAKPGYNSLDNATHLDRSEVLPVRGIKKSASSYQPEGRKSKMDDFFNKFRKSKRVDMPKGVSPGSQGDSKAAHTQQQGSKNDRQVSKTPSVVTLFSTYQRDLFLHKYSKPSGKVGGKVGGNVGANVSRSASVGSSTGIKRIFSRSGKEDGRSITGELQMAAEQCIVKNRSKLSRPVLMKNLAFNDPKLLKNYEYAVSYISDNCKNGSAACLEIRPMIYREDDLDAASIVTSLPNIYILSTYEYLLTNLRMCGSFRTMVKSRVKENKLTPTDIVQLLSSAYFKSWVNTILVKYLISFLMTKKPALKIYFGESYAKLSAYILDAEVNKMIGEMLDVALRWTQAFQQKFSDESNRILLRVHKKLAAYSKNRNGRLAGKFRTLEELLLRQKVASDVVSNQDQGYRLLIQNVLKYVQNVHFTVMQ
ncbi:hypothetical protein PCYB_146900 [Plasmodium cynomolgi strain B]|uniref:Uncharacterized protein n=1 Tax=Plasmodium cynomolgi (strain B) TaxID=1120755 RepID=K6VIP6_PLACD|nr:hypothetical protein PCYB_146900 [Plasmodium cynomolgi strain B]GAB69262.1 hypothetical protein PCYB_146900 [Plasmodium cynomolgi strain B]